MPLGVKIPGLKTKAARSAVPPAVWADVYKYESARVLNYCITIITTVLHDVLLLLPYYTMCYNREYK